VEFCGSEVRAAFKQRAAAALFVDWHYSNK
jgi:hypothetical protein